MGKPTALERYAKGQIHPCCASVHTAVDALVDLMNEHDLQVDEIKSVETVVNKISYDLKVQRSKDRNGSAFQHAILHRSCIAPKVP